MKRRDIFAAILISSGSLASSIQSSPPSDTLSLTQDDFHVILDPLNKAVLSSQISSPIVKIQKKLGEAFDEGDTLLQLDDSIYSAAFQKAKAVLERAVSVYQAKEELYEAKIASLSELKEAFALWASAQSDYELAKKQLAACSIVAPYRGKIANVILFEHELPQVGQPLVEIVGDEILLAKMLIDAKYLNQLQIGRPISIYVKELDQNLPAKIKRVGSVIDPSSSTITVEAEIENPDRQLMSGMTGITTFNENPNINQTIGLKKNEEPDVSSIAVDALLYDGDLIYRLSPKTKLPKKEDPIHFTGILSDAIDHKSSIPQPLNTEIINYHGGFPDEMVKMGELECDHPSIPLHHNGNFSQSIVLKASLPETLPTEPLNYDGQVESSIHTGSLPKIYPTDPIYHFGQVNFEIKQGNIPESLPTVPIKHDGHLASILDDKSSLPKIIPVVPLNHDGHLASSLDDKSTLPKIIPVVPLNHDGHLASILDDKSSLPKIIPVVPLNHDGHLVENLDSLTTLPDTLPTSPIQHDGSLAESLNDKSSLPSFLKTQTLERNSHLAIEEEIFKPFVEPIKERFLTREGDINYDPPESDEIAVADYPLAPPIGIDKTPAKKPAVKIMSIKTSIREDILYKPWEETIGSGHTHGKEIE